MSDQDIADLLGIHRLIYQERWARGLSQSGLARRSGVPQSMISRIEAGRRIPTWATLVTLLGALDLQPAIAAVPAWSDVELVSARMRGRPLEERCADLEPWLRDTATAAREVPMAICGTSAAQLYDLPVFPRRIELATTTDARDVEGMLCWLASQAMEWIEPRTQLRMHCLPDLDQLLYHGEMVAWWGRYNAKISCRPDYHPDQVIRLRIFGFDLPVLSLQALTSSDPWTRRVLRAQRER